MSDAPADNITFPPYGAGFAVLFGNMPAGLIIPCNFGSDVKAQWCSWLPEGEPVRWRPARSIEDAKERMRSHIARWDAATKVAPDAERAKRIVNSLRIAGARI